MMPPPLVVNARDAMPGGGSIEVRSEPAAAPPLPCGFRRPGDVRSRRTCARPRPPLRLGAAGAPAHHPSAAPPSRDAWNHSEAALRDDRNVLKQLAADPAADLFAPIPHGTGQTILRELLLVADHNAYHVGQLVLLRRALGIWA